MAVTLTPVPRFPMVRPGDDLAELLIAACEQGGWRRRTATSWWWRRRSSPKRKDAMSISRRCGRLRAPKVSRRKSTRIRRLVEVISSESQRVVRHRPGVSDRRAPARLHYGQCRASIDRMSIPTSAPSRCCCYRSIRMPRPRRLRDRSARTSAAGLPSSSPTAGDGRGGAARSASHWRRGPARTHGSARADRSVRARAARHRNRIRRRDRQRSIAHHGAGRRGAAGGVGARAVLDGAATPGGSLIRPPDEDLFR